MSSLPSTWKPEILCPRYARGGSALCSPSENPQLMIARLDNELKRFHILKLQLIQSENHLREDKQQLELTSAADYYYLTQVRYN